MRLFGNAPRRRELIEPTFGVPSVSNTDAPLTWEQAARLAGWITPTFAPRRFDTWFFLAAAPPEQVGAHDGKESTDSIWVSPREALELLYRLVSILTKT